MDVNSVNNLSDPYESDKAKKVPPKKDEAAARKLSQNTDDISISDDAKLAFDEENFIKTVNDLPDVRTELVEKAKLDLENGTLLSPDVIEQTAEKIASALPDNTLI